MTETCDCCGEYSSGINPHTHKCWYCMSYCSDNRVDSPETVKNPTF